MLQRDDIIEAIEDLATDDGPVSAGMRLVVCEVSPSGDFLRAMWHAGFVRAAAFQKVGELRRVEAGAAFVAVPI